MGGVEEGGSVESATVADSVSDEAQLQAPRQKGETTVTGGLRQYLCSKVDLTVGDTRTSGYSRLTLLVAVGREGSLSFCCQIRRDGGVWRWGRRSFCHGSHL